MLNSTYEVPYFLSLNGTVKGTLLSLIHHDPSPSAYTAFLQILLFQYFGELCEEFEIVT